VPAAKAAGFGYPVYTRAEIDAWSTGSVEYTRLAGSWAGNMNRTYAPFDTEISSEERDVFRDQSVYIKVQAVLWAADGNAARRNKVRPLLNANGSPSVGATRNHWGGGWGEAAQQINTLEAHARDRLRAAYAHHAQRVLAYLNTGVIPAPATARGDGGDAYLMAWIGACTLFGANTPADVQTLCRHARVTGRPAAGANHLVAEAFAA
jgi:hypothetical protein